MITHMNPCMIALLVFLHSVLIAFYIKIIRLMLSLSLTISIG